MSSKARVQTVKRAVAAEKKRIVEVGRFIHANPEIGFKEFKASERIRTHLQELGYAVTAPFAGLDTAFRAVLKGKGPKIAVLAEYDALAGLGHGCGHNLITVTALTAAAGVAGSGRQWPGQFEIIGTPAEELLAGKCPMVERGAFDHLDACFMTHPSNVDSVSRHSNAFKSFKARFHGKAAHAAAAPQEGINALDAAILFFNSINALRQHLPEDARIHGIILKGGTAANVIPELAEIEVGVRSQDEEYLTQLCRRVATACRSAARAVGATVSLRWDRYWYRALRLNPALDTILAESYAQAGIRMSPQANGIGRGSLDMGNVSQVVPAAHPFFNIIPKGGAHTALHTRDFMALAATPYAYGQALKAGTGMALAALELLSSRTALQRVKAGFRKG